MQQIAVFVDAKWLIAEAAQFFGGQEPSADPAAVVAALRARARAIAPGSRLLRIYWYDPDGDAGLAKAPDIKLRKAGGIADDLGALGGNRVIADALVIAGDAALASAFEAAQAQGVRIHLAVLGTAESALAADADSVMAWGRGDLAWLAPRPTPTSTADFERILDDRMDREIEALSDEDIDAILAYAEFSNGRVPQQFDRPMLSRLGAACSRTLTEKERETFRKRLIHELRLELEPVDEDEDESA